MLETLSVVLGNKTGELPLGPESAPPAGVREQEGGGRSWEAGNRAQSCSQPCLPQPGPQDPVCPGGDESPPLIPSWGQYWDLALA